MFFVVFLGAHFSHNLQFRGPFGVQFVMLFGVPGTLGNRLKTLKGIRFSHFGGPFCRYDFQARSGDCLLSIFTIFDDLGTSFRGVFWDKNVKKWSIEKQTKNESNIFMQAMQVNAGNPGYSPCGPLEELKNNQQLVPSFLP